MIRHGKKVVDANAVKSKPVPPHSSASIMGHQSVSVPPVPGHMRLNSVSSSDAELDRCLMQLSNGVAFKMYYFASNGQLTSVDVNLFYAPPPDSLDPHNTIGCLCWSPPGQLQRMDAQSLSLNTILKMGGGKDTPIFKNPLCAPLSPDHCLSVIGTQVALNLQAASHDIRDHFLHSLHIVLTKLGRRAVDPAAAAPPSRGGGRGAHSIHRPLTEPQLFTWWRQSTGSHAVSAEQVQVVCEGHSSGGADAVQLVRIGSAALHVSTLVSVTASKDGASAATSVWRSPATQHVSSDTSLTITAVAHASGSHVAAQCVFCLEAVNGDVRDNWLNQLRMIMTKLGKRAAEVSTPPTPMHRSSAANNAAGAVANGNAAMAALMKLASAGAAQHAQPSVGSVSVPTPAPAPVPHSGDSTSRVISDGCNFVMHFVAANSQHDQSPVFLFYADDSLFWCAMGQRLQNDRQKIALQSITHVQMGKTTSILKQSLNVQHVAPERCMSIHTSTVALNLQAQTPQLCESFANSLQATMAKLNGGRKPAVPHAPVNSQSIDHKTAMQVLSTGGPFTLFTLGSNGKSDTAESVWLWFVNYSGDDAPGALHWCRREDANGDRPISQNRKFVLNTIRSMKGGRESPVLRNPIASNARADCCWAIFSSTTSLSLEAPSAETREIYIKSVHQLLIRNGMRSIEETKRQQAAMALLQAQQRVPGQSVSAGSGQPRQLPSSSKTAGTASIDRTITFSDPTEFFVIQAKIGEGSYGSVYKALDIRDGRAVAIKVLPFAGRESMKLRKEIKILRQCNSPYIVAYKGAFQRGDKVWIVMEFCAGGSLSDMMQICRHTFTEHQVAVIMKQSLAGVAYLHAEKKIHRDLKGQSRLRS